MNCESVLHQIEVAVKTLIEIVSQLEEDDLQKNQHLISSLSESCWNTLRSFVKRIGVLLMRLPKKRWKSFMLMYHIEL